jgi:hypothetical protein
LTSAAADAPAAAGPAPREFYELRTITLEPGEMVTRIEDYLGAAFVPAARRAGCGPIGVFKMVTEPAKPLWYVLIPHPSIESFVSLHDKLVEDADYRKGAAEMRLLPPSNPPYVNLEIQLLRAFPHFPKLEVPAGKDRIFELRNYRSHSLTAAYKKIEMFDTAGEIDIFRRTGLTPVFYGQNLTGAALPCLTYMLTFTDQAAKDKAWKTFIADPAWKKLSGTPGYTDKEIVVKISSHLLAPTKQSQI